MPDEKLTDELTAALKAALHFWEPDLFLTPAKLRHMVQEFLVPAVQRAAKVQLECKIAKE
jgi:hypothetical protein